MSLSLNLSERYQDILKRIALAASPRSSSAVVLLAVSKGQPAERIEELYSLGHRDFAENYVQELCEKAEELRKRGCSEIRWHFVGHLQTNKAKDLVGFISSVHAVDSEKLARELAKRSANSGRPGKLPVFIEVNIDNEETKSGLSPEEAPGLARVIGQIPELLLHGLMCIPAPDLDVRMGFRKLQILEQRCRPETQGFLSMGMSDDFEMAIQEGATHIRVGTALFGPRLSKGARP